MEVTAKSLILDLLATLRRGAMSVRALVAAGELFGIAENCTRVALARLLAAGRVERDERGQYRLGGRAEVVRRQIDSWRNLDQRTTSWGGSWIGVLATTRSHRPTARDLSLGGRALALLGFRALQPSFHLRPDNLRGGVTQARRDLCDLGLLPTALVFEVADLDRASEAAARSLWDTGSTLADYRDSRAELEKSERRLGKLGEEEAMVESFLVGGRVIRQLALDPLLPQELVPPAERDALVDTMRRYDRVGRACWSGFRKQFGVNQVQSPANTQSMSGTGLGAAAVGGNA